MRIVSELDIHILQENLSSVSKWGNNNNLAFNIPKFVFLHYHSKFNSVNSINGNIIIYSDSCKDVGIHLSDDLLKLTSRALLLKFTNLIYLDYFIILKFTKELFVSMTRFYTKCTTLVYGGLIY